MSYALVFPGQGAQEVGMCKDLWENFQIAKDVFAEADEACRFPLSKIIFEGPEGELQKTANTQPAIMTVSIALYRTLEKEFGVSFTPKYAAGHSLGEYTAAVAAGTLAFADAVSLVHLRGAQMQMAVPLGDGAMSAIMGLDYEAVRALCEEATQPNEVCQSANINAPNQVVVSGHAASVERVSEIAKGKGAKKVIPLKVSAPFHCDLMRPVADILAETFLSFTWKDPKWPIVTNADAEPVALFGQLQNALYRQTFSPVLWSQSVERMAQDVDAFVEIGPGSVLTGLIKRIAKDKATCNASCVADLEPVAAFVRGA